MGLHLEDAEPGVGRGTLLLVEPDGEPVAAYATADRSFRRIERHGRTFRLAGRDRTTGSLVYTPLCGFDVPRRCLKASTRRVMYASTETADLCDEHARLVEQIEAEWDQAEAEMLDQP